MFFLLTFIIINDKVGQVHYKFNKNKIYMEQRFRTDLSAEFVADRKAVIEECINRYNNRGRIQDELSSSDVSAYTIHNQTSVVPQLQKALKAIANKTYGVCITCGGDIEIERLKCVAGALECIGCIKKHKR